MVCCIWGGIIRMIWLFVASSTWRGVFPRWSKAGLSQHLQCCLSCLPLTTSMSPVTPQAPSSFGWAFLLIFKYSCASLVLCHIGKEKRMDFKPPTYSHPNWALCNPLPLPRGRAGDLEWARGGQDKVHFPTGRLQCKQALRLTPLWAFTRVSRFMGSEVKSGVFGSTVWPLSAQAGSVQTLPAVPKALPSVMKSKHLVPWV